MEDSSDDFSARGTANISNISLDCAQAKQVSLCAAACTSLEQRFASVSLDLM